MRIYIHTHKQIYTQVLAAMKAREQENRGLEALQSRLTSMLPKVCVCVWSQSSLTSMLPKVMSKSNTCFTADMRERVHLSLSLMSAVKHVSSKACQQ